MVGFGSTLPSPQDDALRTFLPETAIKMVKSCHPRGGAREAGAADGVEIAPNVVHAQHGPAGDLMLGLASRLSGKVLVDRSRSVAPPPRCEIAPNLDRRSMAAARARLVVRPPRIRPSHHDPRARSRMRARIGGQKKQRMLKKTSHAFCRLD